jgi:ethanolaminephosphotransferase
MLLVSIPGSFLLIIINPDVAAIVPFYFSTWEEYHTGVLYLGYINGPTEGLIIAVAMSLVSAYAG